jgi:hypothetical protein
MSMGPGADLIQIDTLKSPILYSPRQLKRALIVAYGLGIKRLVLCEKPRP